MTDESKDLRVNDIKIIPLQSASAGKVLEKTSIIITILAALFAISKSAITIIHSPSSQIDMHLNTLYFIIAGFFWAVHLYIKHHHYPSREAIVSRAISEALEHQQTKSQYQVKLNEETVEEVITFLHVRRKLNSMNKHLYERIISTHSIMRRHNRVISRMLQNGLILPNQGIFTVESTEGYFDLMRHLLGLGVTPSKVYYEDVSEFFAIVFDNIDDAHFAALSKASDQKYEYISSNDIIDFIKKIVI